MKQVTRFEMEYHELEALAKKHYGLDKYSFIATEECGNDTSHDFTVKPEDIDTMEEEDWIAALESKGSTLAYNNYLVLNMLAKDKHIPVGEYLVHVCW